MPIILSEVDNTAVAQTASVNSVWDMLRAKCEESLTVEQCNGLLGYKPIYYPPSCVDKPKIPFWGYLLIGYIAGKFII